jgi:hypothetical protein
MVGKMKSLVPGTDNVVLCSTPVLAKGGGRRIQERRSVGSSYTERGGWRRGQPRSQAGSGDVFPIPLKDAARRSQPTRSKPLLRKEEAQSARRR